MTGVTFNITLILILSSLLGCQSDRANSRGKPSEDIDDVPGYLDSIEKDVSFDDESEITIGSTTIKIPKSSAASDYRIRMSRLQSAPILSETESLVIGDAQGDVVDVELYDPTTNKTLSSSDLLSSYEFKQTFKTSTPHSNFGLMVITDKGTSSEQRVLLPSTELKVTHSAALNLITTTQITVTVQLKVTTATLWLVTYADDALKSLVTATADALSSTGGAAATAVIIKSTSITGAALSINSDAAFVTTAGVSLGLSATGAAEMYITNSSGCSTGGSWETFSAQKSWTLTNLNSVTRVYAKFRAQDRSTSPCVSDSITHDDIPPAPPTAVLDGATSSSTVATPTISWTGSTSSDVSHYEVAIGSTAGGTDKKTWTKVGKINSSSLGGLSLNDGSTYYATVRAVDAAGLYSVGADSDGWTVNSSSLICPTNYVKVPANTELGTAEFCVMKYEAKIVGNDNGKNGDGSYNSSWVSESRMTGTPWIHINRDQAIAECQSLGASYDLLTNAQWQAIARNIESVGSNWSKGSLTGNVDDGNNLNRGATDGIVEEILSASNDNDPCFGTHNSNCTDGNHIDYSQKRTHTLSNGAVIWDIGGNVREWVKDNNNATQGGDKSVTQMTSSTHNLLKWGAAGIYLKKSHPQRGGLGVFYDGSNGAIVRGGDWGSNTTAGVFAASLGYGPSDTLDGDTGFRCAMNGGS